MKGVTNAQQESKTYSAGSNVSISDDGVISATDTNTTYSAGAGLTMSGTTIKHSSSITAMTVGGATAVPVITCNATGHITSLTSNTIYPPTTAGSSGQVWTSNGSGVGSWQTPSSSLTPKYVAATSKSASSFYSTFTQLPNGTLIAVAGAVTNGANYDYTAFFGIKIGSVVYGTGEFSDLTSIC